MTSRYGGYEEREFIAAYYDTAYDERRQQDIDFFVEYSRQAGGSTLELGCGTGRVLIPTAIAGYEVTGLDLSLHAATVPGEIVPSIGRRTAAYQTDRGRYD